LNYTVKNDATRFYILVGEREAWTIALSYTIWGFSERTKGQWNTSNIGDYLGFYVTSPTKRIVGFGEINEKFVDDNIVWPDEKLFNISIWKYRIKFKVYYLIGDWQKGIGIPTHIMLNTGRKVINKQTFSRLLRKADIAWNTKIYDPIFKT
jgi:hypothetical protein